MKLEGKVAFVTGGSQGIGQAIAVRLAEEGADIVLTYRTHPEGAEETLSKVEASGRKGFIVKADLGVVSDIRQMIASAIQNFGKLDILVNNAGILRDKTFHKMEDADWDLVYRVHVEGSYKVTRAAWPHMREQGFGRVIFTASTSGIYGNFGQSNYGMAKLGLYGLTRTLALEGRKNNVLVNAIAPTGGTRMTEGLIPPQVFEQLKPELVSPLVVYLGSEQCQDTGGLFEVGGGWMGKVRWERSLGVGFDPKAGFDAEDVAAQWQQICNFENAAHPADNIEALKEMMANLQKHAG